MKQVILVTLFTFLISVNSHPLQGYVRDAVGNPISMVQITSGNITCYSDSTGFFKTENGVKKISESSLNDNDKMINPPVVKGITLVFKTNTDNVTYDVFSVTGKKIISKNLGLLQSGEYAISPFRGVNKKIAFGIYLIRLTIGQEVFHLKCAYVDRMQIYTPYINSSNNTSRNAKKESGLNTDEIIADKSGYLVSDKTIESDGLVNIIMVAVQNSSASKLSKRSFKTSKGNIVLMCNNAVIEDNLSISAINDTSSIIDIEYFDAESKSILRIPLSVSEYIRAVSEIKNMGTIGGTSDNNIKIVKEIMKLYNVVKLSK